MPRRGGEAVNRSIEEASLRAWPAIEEADLDGWTLRHSDGFTGRANSVQALGSSDRSIETRVTECERWYRERGRPPLFRLTPFSEAGLDGFLADRGYDRFNRTLVLTRPLAGLEATSGGADLTEATLHEWLGRYASLVGRPAAPAAMGQIIERAGGRALPALLWDGQPRRLRACGLAVLDDDLLGLFDLVVDADRRRKGYGEQLVRGLAAWGEAGGARRVYLQVTEDNEPALGLYDKLGFKLAYDYWYRILPS